MKETSILLKRFFHGNVEEGVKEMFDLTTRKPHEREEWEILRALLQRNEQEQKNELIAALGLHTKAMF